ncbi:MAG: hypothetical protein LUF00_06350 [Lachnospiraceae bacterium]|nr:hypothetical protein [Lachnospiraceae bacterium]
MKTKKLGLSAAAGWACAAVTLVDLIAFCIYGAVYNTYFDLAVVIFLALGAVCAGFYAKIDTELSQWANLAAVFCDSFALGVFFLNSFPVWADWNGGFTMYGSQGGIQPVILILVICLVAILAGIVSCFSRKEVAAA